jgi:Zn-dependent protease
VLYAGIYYLLFRDLKSIALLLAVIIVHEAGHFIAMRSYGYTNVRMFFIPLFGAFVSGNPGVAVPARKMNVLLAGPLPGIIIGMAFAWWYSMHQGYIFYQLALMFIILNVFNLLPLTPMDGGQMVETLVPEYARFVQTVFVVLSSMALAMLAYLMRNYLLLVLVLLMWFRLMMIWKRKETDKKNTEPLPELSAIQKIAYAVIWMAFILLPLITLYKVAR